MPCCCKTAVYRESAAASADDKHLRLPPRCLQVCESQRLHYRNQEVIPYQLGNIAAGEKVLPASP